MDVIPRHWVISKQMQEYRFSQVVQNVDMSDKSLVDIGCGFGDFLSILSSMRSH